MLIDTHCHLDATEFDSDRAMVAARASAAGVGTIVVPAVARQNFDSVLDCRRYDGCRVALGIHPMYVDRAEESDLGVLEEMIRRERPVAIGEIGLDFFIPDPDRTRQEYFLTEQLRLARRYDLPVLLHVRRAQDEVLKQLRRIPVPGGIAHAFNGSRQQADAYLAQGMHLGFGGTLTYPRALRIRALAAALPLSAMVLETDAPDLAPAFADDRRNLPEHLPRIAQTLAELRGLPVGVVAAETSANASRLLRLDP